MTGGQRGIIRGVHAGYQRPSAPVLFELAVNTAGLSCQTDRLVSALRSTYASRGGGTRDLYPGLGPISTE